VLVVVVFLPLLLLDLMCSCAASCSYIPLVGSVMLASVIYVLSFALWCWCCGCSGDVVVIAAAVAVDCAGVGVAIAALTPHIVQVSGAKPTRIHWVPAAHGALGMLMMMLLCVLFCCSFVLLFFTFMGMQEN
jgi:hypothetical protein